MTNILDAAAAAVARSLLPSEPSLLVGRRVGTIITVNASPPSVDVALGTTTLPGVKFLQSYTPLAGDTVFVEFAGPDPLVTGKASTGTGGGAMPVGSVTAFAGAAAPPGWVLCQGQAISRATYAALYGVIGTTYGAGDGSTTFNVPNLTGRFVAGFKSDDTSFDALGETGGSKTHALTTAQIPGHTHWLRTDTRDTDHAHNVYARDFWVGTMNVNWSHWHPANWANIHWTGDTVHSHSGRGGIGSEGPWHGANWASAVPVNVEGRDINHQHNGNHDHPSTNWQREAPWNNGHTHYHDATTDAGTGGGQAHPILPPYLVLNYIIRA